MLWIGKHEFPFLSILQENCQFLPSAAAQPTHSHLLGENYTVRLIGQIHINRKKTLVTLRSAISKTELGH